MTMSLMQFLAAAGMLVLAAVLFFAYRRYLSANSERRMREMLVAAGIDPAIATSGEIPTVMKEVRQRCRSCGSEDVCERWLQGEKEGGNAFCPNAKVFEILGKYG